MDTDKINLQQKQSSKFMNPLAVIIDETRSGKKRKSTKGFKKQGSPSKRLKHVDEGWLRRCSANSLPITSSDDEDIRPVKANRVSPAELQPSTKFSVDFPVELEKKENPKKRPLETVMEVNEEQASEFTEEVPAIDQPQRKFFKTRLYSHGKPRPQYKLQFRNSPKKSTSTKVATPKSKDSKGVYDISESDDDGNEMGTLFKKKSKGKRTKQIDGTPPRKKAAPRNRAKPKPVQEENDPIRRTRSAAKNGRTTANDEIPSTSSTIYDDNQSSSKPKSSKTAVCDVYDEVNNQNDGKGSKRKFRRPFKDSAKRTLKNVNDNFVKVDVEKKKFVRGKKKISGAKTKRNDWKQRKIYAAKEARVKTSKCHKCGELGHYAMYCLKDIMEEELIPENIENSPFPTLEEAAQMVWSRQNETSFSRLPYEGEDSMNHDQVTSDADRSRNMEEGLPTASQSETFELAKSAVHAVDPILSVGDLSDEDKLLNEGLRTFKFESFRPGQREAIARVLQGLSTLLVLGTGCGKSLCYQLPAYLYAQKYPGVLSICVSPLVSLMEDQVKHVPDFLNAACLHTQMTTRQKEIVLDKIKRKRLDILLVSPEAICSGLFGLLRNVEEFPAVAFACIDEVHCVSEWSHNFRPSYLKLCKVLRDKLNIKTILGLTATATNHTAYSVCEHLKIDPSSRIQGELLPSNLNLSVSKDIERDHALIELLHGERFKDCDSIIIYCTRRNECDRVVTLIRTALKPVCESNNSKVCDVYHAGQTGSHRRRVQNDFMAGKIRIVVATVAFGMGINKSNIRAIIHFNMPKTFESYVQEIGRAGRDGKSAECHVFLGSSKGMDLAELRRHIYGNYIDRSTLRKLIKKIFRPCKCGKINKLRGIQSPDKENKKSKCCGHEVSFSVAETSLDIDIAEENIETLLCYLELDTKRKWVEILPKCYQTCKIQTYGGSKLLLMKSRKSPPLAAAIALQKENKQFKEGSTYLEFNVVELASTLGWNSAIVRRELKSLEWTGIKFDNEGKPTAYRKSGILVEFSDLAHRVVVPGDLNDDEYDELLNTLQERCVQQERMQLYQLQKTHEAFHSVSSPNILSACDSYDPVKCDKLKNMILEYFDQTSIQVPAEWKPISTTIPRDVQECIRQDILNLFASQRDTIFTGRAIAKIFQGIGSPCFPADQWNRNRSFWRKYIDADFNSLVRLAGEEVMKYQ